MFKGCKIHLYNILFILNYAFLLVDNRIFFFSKRDGCCSTVSCAERQVDFNYNLKLFVSVYLLVFFVCMCVHMYVHMCLSTNMQVRGRFIGIGSLFLLSRFWGLVSSGKCVYLQSHLTDPEL